MLSDIAEIILRYLIELVLETICFYTGEFILYALSLGRRKPRWSFYRGDRTSKYNILFDRSVLMGLAFWILVVGCAVWAFL